MTDLYARKAFSGKGDLKNPKLYDLGSGYLGEMPIAKVKLYEGDRWHPVYSAECLLIDIEKEGDFRVGKVSKEKNDYAETHREELIL